MAFLVASISSSLESGFPIDVFSYFSVYISEGSSALTDNVVYERNVSECVKISYLQKNAKKFLASHCTPLGLPSPQFKNAGYATVVPLYSK